MNSIAILKTGRYTDANGHTYDITRGMLEDMAAHTPKGSAPLVKGHPSNEAPAMGWVEKLRAVGDTLYAAFTKLAPEFAEEVKAEAFRNVSASFFQPYAPSNPKQGHYVLRHVGALGAARPAIPGLGTLQEALAFAGTDAGTQNSPGMGYKFWAEQDDGIIALSENEPAEDKSLLERVMGLFHSAGERSDALKAQIREELLAEFTEMGLTIPKKENQKEASMPDESRIAELEKQLAASNTALAKEKAERERLAKEAETQAEALKNKAAVSAEVDKLGETKEIGPDKKEGLIDKALALVGAGQTAAQAVAAFGEYLPNKQAPRKNWGVREEGRGLGNFSEQGNPAFGEDFALKKAAHEKAGLSPDAAYDAAMRDTQRGNK